MELRRRREEHAARVMKNARRWRAWRRDFKSSLSLAEKNALSGVVKKLRLSAKWVKNTLRVW